MSLKDRHPNAGMVVLPPYDLYGVPALQWLFALSVEGQALATSFWFEWFIHEQYPLGSRERFAYYYALTDDVRTARAATLREYVALCVHMVDVDSESLIDFARAGSVVVRMPDFGQLRAYEDLLSVRDRQADRWTDVAQPCAYDVRALDETLYLALVANIYRD